MKAGPAQEKMTPTLLDRRTGAERRSPYCRVSYAYEAGGVTHANKGFARDFSKKGCGIRGEARPHVGSKTALTLFLDRKPPLCVDATVTWVAGDFFGVEFPSLDDDDYDRMRRFMQRALYR